MSFSTTFVKCTIFAIFSLRFEHQPSEKTGKYGRIKAALNLGFFLMHTAAFPLHVDTLLSSSKCYSTDFIRPQQQQSEKNMAFQEMVKFPHF